MEYTYERVKEILSAQGATVWAQALMWAIDSDIELTRKTFESSETTEDLLRNQGVLNGKRVLRGIIWGLLQKDIHA